MIRTAQVIAAAVLLAQLGLAATVALEWDATTNFVDGTPVTEPVSYKVYQARVQATYQLQSNGNVVRVGIDTNYVYDWSIGTTNTSVTITNAAGFYSYAVTAWVGDSESAMSSNLLHRLGTPSTVKAVRSRP